MSATAPTVNDALRLAVQLAGDLATLPTHKALSVADAAITAEALRRRVAGILAFIDEMELCARMTARARPQPAPAPTGDDTP